MNILTKRIPSLAALAVLIFGLTAAVFLTQRNQQVKPRASGLFVPANVVVSNISDKSFTVSWTTATMATGRVSVGKETRFYKWVGDIRDIYSQELSETMTHSVTVEDLKPQTKYIFQIESGGVLFDNGGSAFEVMTGGVLTGAPPASDIAQGTVRTQDGNPAAGMIIYVQLPGGQLISGLTTESGNWLLPLSISRTVNLSNWLSYDRLAAVYVIRVEGGVAGSATVVVTTGIDQPLPPIILGENLDLRQGGAIDTSKPVLIEDSTEVSADASIYVPNSQFNFEILGPVQPVTADVTLFYPGSDGERIAAVRPEFFGQGPGNFEVNITIESPAIITGKVTTDDNGRWSFAVPSDLIEGWHTVTLQWLDEDGAIRTLKRSFIVQAAGEEPAFTASPSAIPQDEEVVPTQDLLPTPTLSVRKTAPADSDIPQSGDLKPAVVFSIIGILLMVVGGLLL